MTPAKEPSLLDLVGIADPGDRLVALYRRESALRLKLDATRTERRRAIAELRELGLTWRVIGDLIGVSAQAAERLGATTTTKDT